MKTFIVLAVIAAFLSVCAYIYYWLRTNYAEMIKRARNEKEQQEQQAQEPKEVDEKAERFARILELRAHGWSYSQIAKEMGISKTSVIRHLQRGRRK